MPGLEDVGRTIDRELQKLLKFFENEVKPTTKKSAVDALRAASRRLTRLAEDLEGAVDKEKK